MTCAIWLESLPPGIACLSRIRGGPLKMRFVLFQPDIPQNVGAAIRLAACLGVRLEVVEPCGFPLSDKSARRAAMDYGSPLDLVRHASWEDFIAAGWVPPGRLILFTTRAKTAYVDFSFSVDDVLLFGRESAGAPEAVHAAADAALRIPIHGRSLNLVNAAAMALGEALRQTGGFPSAAD